MRLFCGYAGKQLFHSVDHKTKPANTLLFIKVKIRQGVVPGG